VRNSYAIARHRLASTSFVVKSLLGFLLSRQFSCLSDFLRNRPSRPRVAKLLIDWQITSSWPDRNLDNIFLSDAGWREKIAPRDSRFPRTAWKVPQIPALKIIAGLKLAAGHGEMTEYLVRSGVPVYAVELDPPLIERLKRLASKHPNLTVVPGDVLEIDLRIACGRPAHPPLRQSSLLHHFANPAPLLFVRRSDRRKSTS